MARYVVGVSGASGIILAHRTVEALTSLGHHVELVMSRDAAYTALEEMGPEYGSIDKFVASFTETARQLVRFHKISDFGAPIASGSFPVDGMIIVPCSMATLAAVAVGLSDNLLRRSADVTMKERRPLIIVPRESPLSAIHLENMLKVTHAGATIVLPLPAWYTHPESLYDVEMSIVGRTLDSLKIPNTLYKRWKA